MIQAVEQMTQAYHENPPIAVFAYNRPKLLRETLGALCKNTGAEEFRVFIFIDGPRKAGDAEKVRECVEISEELRERKCFLSTDISTSPANKGLAASVISGVSDIMERFGEAIVLEDDLITERHFLSFMKKCLDYYRDVPDIWSISGYTPYLRRLRRYPHDIYYSYRGCSWGWGTWRDRWRLVDWEVSSYDRFLKDSRLQRRLNRGGGDMAQMLKDQMNGAIDSWAIRWCYEQSLRDMYTVYPVQTFIENRGFGESATHTKKKSLREAQRNLKEDWRPERLKVDKGLSLEFYYSYTDTLYKKLLRNANPEGIKKQLAKLFSKGAQ
ncbi:MAG TPA: sugar transferase [Lachnospiraceae bacterium]|nr:sugar transferase [Lachnospiraceae bacterium]